MTRVARRKLQGYIGKIRKQFDDRNVRVIPLITAATSVNKVHEITHADDIPFLYNWN